MIKPISLILILLVDVQKSLVINDRSLRMGDLEPLNGSLYSK